MKIVCSFRRIPISKLLFMPLMKGFFLICISFFIWWHLSPLKKESKKKVFSFSSDLIVSFLFITFLFQFIFHFSSILRSPYEWMLLSGQSLTWGLLATVLWTGWKKRKLVFSNRPLYNSFLQFLLTAGMVNFIYYAFIYNQFVSFLSAVWMHIGLLSLIFLNKRSYIPLLISIVVPFVQWLIFKNNSFLFFEFALPSKTLILSASLWIGIVLITTYNERRELQSELN